MENNQLIKYNGGLIKSVGNVINITNKLLAQTEPRLIPYRKKNKWGFCTPDKKIVIDCIYDEVSRYSFDLSMVKLNEKYGYIDRFGNIILSILYSGPFYSGYSDYYVIIECQNKQGLYNLKSKKIIIDCIYCSLFRSGKLLRAELLIGKIAKIGVISINNEEIIPCIYKNLSIISRNVFRVEKFDSKGKFGLINRKNEEIYPCVCDEECEILEENLIEIKKNGRYGCISEDKSVFIDCIYDKIVCIQNERILVILNGKWGIIDKEGNEIVPCKFDHVEYFSDYDIAKVKINDKYGYVGKKGVVVIPIIYEEIGSINFNEKYIEAKLNRKMGFINKEGDILIPFIYENVYSFWEGLAGVILNGKFGFIDTNGIPVIPIIYDNTNYCSSFEDNLSNVTLNGKIGRIDKNGNINTPFIYDEISFCPVQVEFLIWNVLRNGKWGLINEDGEEFIQCEYDEEIGAFSQGLAVVVLNGKCGYIDKKGKILIGLDFDFARDFENGFAQVFVGEKSAYINLEGKIMKWGSHGRYEKNNDLIVVEKNNKLVGYMNSNFVEYWED